MTRSIDEQENTRVINLDARRKRREAWDKPLTTEYATDKQNNARLYYLNLARKLSR